MVFADVVHPRNVFMIESGHRLSFVSKTPLRFLVDILASRENLDRDRSIESRVETTKHGAHAASADE